MKLGSILIRADASVEIGTGHVMRCLALAQAWQDVGGEATFAMAESTPGILKRLAQEGFEVGRVGAAAGSEGDAACTAEMAKAKRAGWIIADGYSLGADYQRRVKGCGLGLLCVDDNAEAGEFFADVIVNQNLHAREALYRGRAAEAKLLLGPKYGLLRREFKTWRGWRREIRPEARRVLVTMGGSDALNLSERVMRAIEQIDSVNVEVTLVVGGSNPHFPRLQELAEESGGRVRLAVDANNMPELMAWADVAVSAAGSTCWEMCMMGLPAVVIDVAANQLALAEELQSEGIAVHMHLGDATVERIAERVECLLRSCELRSEMGQRATELVGGGGAARVVATMRERGIGMRRAEAGDCRILFEWANDAAVRQASFASAAIPWDEHSRWFAEKMRDRASMILMFDEEQGGAAGTVRFQFKDGGDAEISVTVAPEFRGQGLAAHFLERAVEFAFEHSSVERIQAFIRTGNRVSAKAFEKAGFFLVGTTNVKGENALHYTREREAVAVEPGNSRAVEMARWR